MQKTFAKVVCSSVIFCLTIALLGAVGCGGEKPDAYIVTIQNLKISDREAISAFELDIKGGTVQIASSLPVGWDVTVENEVGYNSKVKASSRLGSANLSLDELKRVVFTVKRNQATGADFFIGGAFVMVGGGEKPRTVPVTTQDFALTGA